MINKLLDQTGFPATTSLSRHAAEAMNADFYSKLQRSDCTCNEPEPVKTWSASASRYSIGPTSVTANITYNNPCGTSKSITWSIKSDQGSTTYTDSKTDTVPIGSGSFRSTITTSVAIAANVTVSGSASGNC